MQRLKIDKDSNLLGDIQTSMSQLEAGWGIAHDNAKETDIHSDRPARKTGPPNHR
mgnify:CR=1 FL=1